MHQNNNFSPAACSSMQLTSSTGRPYWLRTCDLDEDIRAKGSHLVSVPKKHPLPLSQETLHPLHAFCGITFDSHDTWLLDGINDCGLAGGLLMLYEGTSAATAPPSHRGIMGMELVAALLAEYSSVAEILRAVPSLTILDVPHEEQRVPAAMHYFFVDAEGNNVVLEAADPAHPGSITAYPNNIGILTNSPPYPQQLAHLSWFLSASPEMRFAKIDSLVFEHNSIQANPSAPHLTESGVFPASYASYDRFIRAAVFKALNNCGKNFHDDQMLPLGIGLMQPLFEPFSGGVFHYTRLDETGCPIGTKNSHTQYTVFYDCHSKKLLLRPYDTLTWSEFSLSDAPAQFCRFMPCAPSSAAKFKPML